ncbi:preprotein translocase subunit YajC [Pseudoduganella violaceinigra]|uniref:preprotein translocase subunit YajC n=1 Tax=Pseudoduganella violaceinigra TaxID=246602 RepID=UPI0003F6FDD0|nr:preprotein translocase subunit YajC [Pseudoduganella violaceinigra]
MFISNAYAQTAADAGAFGGLPNIVILVGMLAVMYFVMIRPQQKRAKEQKTMMEALAKGDEVVTIGGIMGKVTKVNDQNVAIEVSQGTEVWVQKHAISSQLPKGTLKSL